MAGKRLIGDDNSINSFDGKTDQIHGQFDSAAPDTVTMRKTLPHKFHFHAVFPAH
jgi:hypothetical protein